MITESDPQHLTIPPRLARNTRDLIRRVYDYEAKDGALHNLHESFKTVLIEDLDQGRFADMVAQTISYGLFSARATGEDVMGLSHLQAMVPNTNPFLKELFEEFVSMSGREKHQIDFDELGVSELVEMLNRVKVEEVLKSFGTQTGGGTQDPVIYFYEDFLKDYDKEQKVKRGEFYTPKPVVSYIVRSVDRVLRDELGCPDGLADTSTMEWNGEKWPKVMILDPATGTGTFLETVIEVIHETMTEKWKKEGKKQDEIHAAWNEYVPRHLLPRLHGFELMMAPYSVAHMKLGLKLKETGYEFESDERLRVYLTNTLEEPQDFSGRLYADFLAHEAEAANRVKRDVPITVVIGNPPYASISSNLTPEARAIVDKYRYVEGKRIKERSMLQFEKNIQDDYIKFIAVSQSIVSKFNFGVVGLVTNHSYLDGPTLRGVRHNLLSHFQKLDVVDLHGNSNKKEIAPDKSKDENVFDIQQGVAVCLFRRSRDWERDSSGPELYCGNLWGNRQSKYRVLNERIVQETERNVVSLRGEYYFFVPESGVYAEEWDAAVSLTDIFARYSTGTETGFDKLLLDFNPKVLHSKIARFSDPQTSLKELQEDYGIKGGHAATLLSGRSSFEPANAQQYIRSFQLRAYDYRFAYLKKNLLKTNSFGVMTELAADAPGLVATRQTKETFGVLVINDFCGHKCTSSYDRSYVFPLWSRTNGKLASSVERQPALKLEFLQMLGDRLGVASDGQWGLPTGISPNDVFHYIVAIFSSPLYQSRFEDKLKRHFPQLPLTSSLDLFSKLCERGEQLVSLHLMRSPLLDDAFTTFPKSGSNVMEKAKHDPGENRVYINKEEQYFDNVPEETWNFRVGGHQVLDKWLKDRKGRNLSEEDIKHYRRVVKALHETARIMREIDEVIEAHGGWPLAGSVKEERGTES